MQELAHRVVVDQSVRFGKPIIQGTRVPVDLIVAKLGGGMSIEEVMAEYEVTREDVLAALTYASRLVSEERVRAIF